MILRRKYICSYAISFQLTSHLKLFRICGSNTFTIYVCFFICMLSNLVQIRFFETLDQTPIKCKYILTDVRHKKLIIPLFLLSQVFIQCFLMFPWAITKKFSSSYFNLAHKSGVKMWLTGKILCVSRGDPKCLHI